jgi:hypothetical protein
VENNGLEGTQISEKDEASNSSKADLGSSEAGARHSFCKSRGRAKGRRRKTESCRGEEKESQELHEQVNQQLKRQEERRKESADMREELDIWLKSLVPTLVGLMTSLRFSASVSNWVEAVLFYGLITLCVASTVVITRLAVIFVKRLSKN